MMKNLLSQPCLIIMTTNAQKNSTGSTTDKDLVKNNPLVAEWKTPYETPPFSIIKLEHYKPAFEYAIATARQEVYEISAQKSKPTFGKHYCCFGSLRETSNPCFQCLLQSFIYHDFC